MIDVELRRRVERILAGRRDPEDLARLFLGLRSRSHGRAAFLEIGDFVAHRDAREKGPVTDRVADVLISARFWLAEMRKRSGDSTDLAELVRDNWDDLVAVSRANLRLATDAQLAEHAGLSRKAAKTVLKRTLKKLRPPRGLSEKERAVIRFLGGSFIWNPAFDDAGLFDDWIYVLLKNRLLEPDEVAPMGAAKTFVTLFAVAQMHGSAVVLKDAARADLRAGSANREGRIEVRARLVFDVGDIPVDVPHCIFWTSLDAAAHSSPPPGAEAAFWDQPLNVADGERLVVLS